MLPAILVLGGGADTKLIKIVKSLFFSSGKCLFFILKSWASFSTQSYTFLERKSYPQALSCEAPNGSFSLYHSSISCSVLLHQLSYAVGIHLTSQKIFLGKLRFCFFFQFKPHFYLKTIQMENFDQLQLCQFILLKRCHEKRCHLVPSALRYILLIVQQQYSHQQYCLCFT